MRRYRYTLIGLVAALILTPWGVSTLTEMYAHKHYEQPGEEGSDVQYLGFDRVTMQAGAVDCGPAALKMVMAHHGVEASLDTLSNAAGLTAQGVSLLGLRHAAERYGFRGTGWRLSFQGLRAQSLPVLVKVGGCHFAVVDRIDQDVVVMLDPKEGEVHLTAGRFEAIWDGVALAVEPEPQERHREL
jgi:ABC-type bacteriocin/lantibiotic exporter with double-glycine peptidase domain